MGLQNMLQSNFDPVYLKQNFIVLCIFGRIVKFSSVYHLTLHFPKNHGADTTKIIFIGLKGDWSEGHRHGVTLCTYEATPSMADHKDKIIETTNMDV